MEGIRSRQIGGYMTTAPGQLPEWRSWSGLMKALIEKPPQLAAWDRLVGPSLGTSSFHKL
jgi:hypothetical protein